MMNQNTDTNPNGVNDRTGSASQLSPGSDPVADQAGLGRHLTTGSSTRRSYTREENKAVLACYYASQPEKRGYRKRMLNIWQERGYFQITEQRLADQVRTIKKFELFTNEEIQTIEEGELKEDVNEHNVNEDRLPDQPEGSNDNPRGASDNRQNIGEVITHQGVESDKDRELLDTLLDIRSKLPLQRERLPAMRHIESYKIKREAAAVNRVMKYVSVNDITELNDTIMAGAMLVTRKLTKNSDQARKQLPAWKHRLQQKVLRLKGELSRLAESRNRDFGDPWRKSIEKKFNIKKMGYERVIETLKQQLKATSQKIRRYNDRCDQYKENQMFRNNQRALYQRLEQKGGAPVRCEAPDSELVKTFWEEIWDDNTKHNEKAKWIDTVKKELENTKRQENVDMSTTDVTRVIKQMPNWKAPGPDGAQGFWLKAFSELHPRIAYFLQRCLEDEMVPSWMTKGCTVLIMKDPAKGDNPGNYRPITCLPLMWKTLTAMITEKLYNHLEEQDLIGEEQKGCRKGTRGTKDHLMLDKVILRDCKQICL